MAHISQQWRQNPVRLLDRLIDGISMTRLLLDVLIFFVLAAAGLSAIGVLKYDPVVILLTAAYLAVVCRIANGVFARIFDTPVNGESNYITALILVLLITPSTEMHNILFMTAAGGLAIASKFILAIHNKHFFNPVAIALVLLYFGSGETASWWISNMWLTPVVVGGGLLVARKIRRMCMVFIFFAAAVVSTVAVTLLQHGNVSDNIGILFQHSALFFLGFVMLTEPFTAPPTAIGRDIYAVLVGLLFPPQMHIYSLYSTPELALTIGNIYSYVISPKVKLLTALQQKLRLAPDIADFIFQREHTFQYRPGQYVEVTLGHKQTDSRGNRRMFTLASSPTEEKLRLGIKFYPKGSSYKQAILAADHTTRFAISPPAGDFVLPKDSSQKLAFIAGGIGVTPYRSMIKYMLDKQESRDIVLIYAEKDVAEFVYTDIFDEAEKQLNAHVVYTVQGVPPPGWTGRMGYVSSKVIAAEIPDYHDRLFYLSGSLPMVSATQSALHELGVPNKKIKTDYFTGYV